MDRPGNITVYVEFHDLPAGASVPEIYYKVCNKDLLGTCDQDPETALTAMGADRF
jgi:hypothetical protein